MRVMSWGSGFFSITIVALGILGLFRGDFPPVWGPVAQNVPARQALIYICVATSLVSGIGLLTKRRAAPSARVLLGTLLLWLLIFKTPDVFRAPLVLGSWFGCAETAVVVAAVWVLYAGLVDDWDARHLGHLTPDRGLRIARALYGLALIMFGLAHFVYLDLTAPLVPAWLPWHVFWAYFTGAAYIAAGVAVILDVYAGWAAALSTLQIGLFTLLVWLPIIAAGSVTTFQWNETTLSWVLTASAWVVAESYQRKYSTKRPRLEPNFRIATSGSDQGD